ncbi:hypothetical protein SynPROS71_00089 [Synechococcus sp. PROS-7-1]|uniref:hypothetical protein n=1 Tax=Synechococcus sp. PROS-7-1 TaxID=1442556 RepID=UPI00164500A9|nr:hypothetical protein [Synechococcus sp. PROS-7-1]QNI83926.1 hypothetical protein SynPROS71_00089 [Synechococcus sp. PROS-7-1]
MYFAEKWNSVVDWSRSRFATKEIPDKPLHINYLQFSTKPDEHGNTKSRFNSAKAINAALQSINNTKDNSLIFLPFDQPTGLLTKLLDLHEVRQDFRNLFIDKNFKRPSDRYACIHIRRGDCTQERHPQWFVDDAFYIKLITLLLKDLPADYEIQICTQGSSEWIIQKFKDASFNGRLKINTTDQLFINDAEINDFLLMKNADILFCAGSSFSYVAAYAGNHKLVFDVEKGISLMLNECINLSTMHEEWSCVVELIKKEIAKFK